MEGEGIADFRFPIADLRSVFSIGNRKWAIGNLTNQKGHPK
jgi:hypothetical protein